MPGSIRDKSESKEKRACPFSRVFWINARTTLRLQAFSRAENAAGCCCCVAQQRHNQGTAALRKDRSSFCRGGTHARGTRNKRSAARTAKAIFRPLFAQFRCERPCLSFLFLPAAIWASRTAASKPPSLQRRGSAFWGRTLFYLLRFSSNKHLKDVLSSFQKDFETNGAKLWINSQRKERWTLPFTYSCLSLVNFQNSLNCPLR